MQILRVENFGKIKKADVEIGDFTVLAGANNTGKSFISKLLYSLLNPMNADLKRDRLRRVVNLLKSHVRQYLPYEERPFAKIVDRKVSEMEVIIANYTENQNQVFSEIISELMQILEEIKRALTRIGKVINAENGKRKIRPDVVALAELSKALDDATKEFGQGVNEWSYAQVELKHRIEQNLIRNFQIPNISILKGQPNKDSKIDLDDLLQMTISDQNIELRIGPSLFAMLDGITNVVYFESPTYWKLFTAIREIGTSSRFRSCHRDMLTGVPEYFYDIARSLTFEYTGEMAYPEVYQSLVGSDVIGGCISISERGEITFQEDGRSYPLHVTATGVANIGFLAALIERKVIDRGTMLFINEPEAHLHPSWQVVVAEALFNLAKEGVKIVMATHSLNILKWLEVHIEKYPDDERIATLNYFPNPVQTEDDFKIKMANIKKELSKPFADLYLEGL